MANEKQLRILKRGVRTWNQWRSKKPDEEVDLRGADLRAVFLPGADLIEANLEDAVLSEADLTGAQLTGAHLKRAQLLEAKMMNADLQHANLVGANLHRANLSGAYLFEANLWRAIMTNVAAPHADFSRARLYDVDFRNADMRGALLEEAALISTSFCRAQLQGAVFDNALLMDTVFGDVDLKGATGLDKCSHRGPSIMSFGTLAMSGPLPLNFLRGCGLPDTLIEYAPSLLLNNPIEFYSCFISYSHEDKSFARRLHDALQGRGIRCWLDEHQLLPGHDIFEEVDRGIKLWDKVLLCCSEFSLSSWWVDNEVQVAFDKEQSLMRRRKSKTLALIPLNLDGYMFSGKWKSGKAAQIKSRLAADFTGWERDNRKFEEQFDRLVKALRTNDGREPPPPQRL